MDKIYKDIKPEILCMIEPRLTSYSGHLYNYASSLKNISERNNIKFKILVSSECNENICKDLNASVVFEKNPSQKYFKNIFSKFFLSTYYFNKHLYNGLKKISNTVNNKWILFMGTTQYIDLFAIFLFNFFLKSRPKIILTLRMSIYRYDIKRWSINVILYRLGFILLYFQNKLTNNIYLITDSEMLKTEFERITDFKINVLPIPHTINANMIHGSIDNHKNFINVVSLGPARSQKGFSLICDLVDRFLKESNVNNVKFFLQCNNSNNEINIENSINYLESLNNKNIILFKDDLSENVYYSLLAKSDIVLLPYNSKFYHVQTSGIFTEALSFGKITIVSDNTWMSSQLKKYNSGFIFQENNFASFYLKFQNALKSINTVENEYKILSNLWNEYHNAENFYNKLIQLN